MWCHPTGNHPTIVTLLCLGPSQHDYITAAIDHDRDESLVGSDEVWTLNRGLTVYDHDLLFVMDHITGEAEADPDYGMRLWHHAHPIITSDNATHWPPHVHCYPFEEIQDWLAGTVKPAHSDWWHNSVPYIIVYAGFIGVKRLRIWGADYHHHRSNQVEDGHPNVAYWTGIMEQVGLTVHPISSSTLLGANQRHVIYGYQTDPRLSASNRRRRFWHQTGHA